MPEELVSVRYLVDDVEAAIAFYTTHLGFEPHFSALPAFADVVRGRLRLLLSGPRSSAGRSLSDGRTPAPGGWNRIHLIVDDIAAEVARLEGEGVPFRSDIVTGPGGRQIVLDDPAGNPVELFPTGLTAAAPGLRELLREWGRIGCIGFGGPPAHIALLRRLVVDRRRWIGEREFEDAIAATNLIPGPASTQLAIYCAWRLRGVPGALVGGVSFIAPGLVAILALSALFLADSPPEWVLGAGAGAGAAVAAVAVHAASGLVPASWSRSASRMRWALYALAGAISAATVGPFLVLVLLACGAVEVAIRRPWLAAALHPLPLPALTAASVGGLPALAWVALKVGALSYGGGFVIVPLMQHDAVETYRWMTDAQFLNAVALGQVTPGPVVHTVAAVGYAAAGLGGGLLAAAVAFAPSFSFILLGAERFDRLRANPGVRGFLDGAGPAAIGAIAGAALPLAAALGEPWQFAILAAAVAALFVAGRGVVFTLVGAGVAGVILTLAGAALPA